MNLRNDLPDLILVDIITKYPKLLAYNYQVIYLYENIRFWWKAPLQHLNNNGALCRAWSLTHSISFWRKWWPCLGMPKEHMYFQSRMRKPIVLGKEFWNYLLLEPINRKSWNDKREKMELEPHFTLPPPKSWELKKEQELSNPAFWEAS